MIKVKKCTETPRLFFNLLKQNDKTLNENDIELLKQYATERHANYAIKKCCTGINNEVFIFNTPEREYIFFKAGKNIFRILIRAINQIGNTPIKREVWFFN